MDQHHLIFVSFIIHALLTMTMVINQRCWQATVPVPIYHAVFFLNIAGLYSNASAFALVSANAAFAFALAFDCPEVGAFAFALAFESKTFAFALAFDSNAFDWIQMPIKCDLNVTL